MTVRNQAFHYYSLVEKQRIQIMRLKRIFKIDHIHHLKTLCSHFCPKRVLMNATRWMIIHFNCKWSWRNLKELCTVGKLSCNLSTYIWLMEIQTEGISRMGWLMELGTRVNEWMNGIALHNLWKTIWSHSIVMGMWHVGFQKTHQRKQDFAIIWI